MSVGSAERTNIIESAECAGWGVRWHRDDQGDPCFFASDIAHPLGYLSGTRALLAKIPASRLGWVSYPHRETQYRTVHYLGLIAKLETSRKPAAKMVSEWIENLVRELAC